MSTRPETSRPNSTTADQPESVEHSAEHAFKGTWRWPEQFEAWVEDLFDEVDGKTANVFAGLSPLCDVRFDIRSPAELVKNLQQDKGTNLSEAREYLDGFVVDDAQFDVVGSLYGSSTPEDSFAANYLDSGGLIKADILENGLPVQDAAFEMTVCDPPWKNIPNFDFLLSELVRVTEPGSRILFNSYTVPTGDLPITLDYVDIRRDDTRWKQGTPNISWVCLYTVHPSIDVLRHLPRTLGQDHTFEFAPVAETFDKAIRAERIFELARVHEIPIEAFDADVVDPATSDRACPMCGCTLLDPLLENSIGESTNEVADFYECFDCGFRATEQETQESAAGHSEPHTGAHKCTPQI